MPQEAHFWSRSIIDNFRLSFPQVSFEKIVKACQITGADEFISQLPDKYQTILGEFGANISGGQKQKLAIARAIVNNPPVLILDESTNSLDPLSETQVLDRLFSFRRGKTTAIGQQVQMRVSACPYTDYGTLEGLVTAISPDAIARENNPASTSFLLRSKIPQEDGIAYEVTIEPAKLTLGQENQICTIQSGMEGQAEIISRKETVLAFILRKTRLIANI